MVLFKQNLNKIYVEKALSDFTMPGPIQEKKGMPVIFPKKDKKGKKMLKKHKQGQNKLEKLKLTGKCFFLNLRT